MTFELVLSWVLFLHLVSDWWMQTDWMARNKSHNWKALWAHCGVMFNVLWLGMIPLTWDESAWAAGIALAGLFAATNALGHFAIDAVTSRLTAPRWNNGQPNRLFWNIIGTDQFLHLLLYVWSLKVLGIA